VLHPEKPPNTNKDGLCYGVTVQKPPSGQNGENEQALTDKVDLL
jgi:hypothetical protein